MHLHPKTPKINNVSKEKGGEEENVNIEAQHPWIFALRRRALCSNFASMETRKEKCWPQYKNFNAEKMSLPGLDLTLSAKGREIRHQDTEQKSCRVARKFSSASP